MDRIVYCSWLILLAIGTQMYGNNNVASQINALAAEMFDVSKNPDKHFSLYMDDLICILSPIEHARPFCQKMEKLKNSKNGTVVGVAFIQYRKLFSQDLINTAVAIGKDRLMEIFKFRTNARSR